MIQRTARKLLRKVGYDVQRYVSSDFATRPAERRLQLMRHYGINLVFDVGANVGQYAQDLRRMGYNGRIVSFEPLSAAYKQLRTVAADDSNWECAQVALGDFDGASEINVAANSQSSSLLSMLPEHEHAAPESRYIGKEEIVVSRLETILDAFMKEEEKLFLKIDAQGYEKRILDGADAVMNHITGVQVEASLVQLYDGEMVLDEMVRFMHQHGFTLMSIEPGFSSGTTGQMYQADLVFFRKDVATSPSVV